MSYVEIRVSYCAETATISVIFYVMAREESLLPFLILK
jgi:hypothetical protein